MSKIKEIIDNPHPIYKRYVQYWNFLLNAYEGGVDYTNAEIPMDSSTSKGSDVIPVYANGELVTSRQLSNNLFKHPKEKSEHFSQRLSMSYYYNFCQPIIDIYTEHLFKQPVIEDFKSLDSLVEIRKDNIDMKGSSLVEIRKEISDMCQIYGHCFALVDMPPSNGEVSLEQRIINDQFPYVNIFCPQMVINWSLDRFGMPYWVLVCEPDDYNADPDNFDKSAKATMSYRLWTRTEWFLYNSNYELVDSGTHSVGMVPIVVIYDRPSKKSKYLGISSLSDIAFIARDIYNLCSELNQIIRDQTFSFLAIQGDAVDYQGDNEIGTRKGLIYPRDTLPPQYISPSKDNAQVVMDQIDRQVHKIYQLAKLEGGSAHQNEQIQSQSGVSKAFDFQQTNSALSRKANNLNDGELKIWDLIAKWEGTEFDGSIEYPDEFSVQAVNDDIAEALEMNKLAIGKLAKIETNKAILQKKFPRLPDNELDKIIKDMESEVNKSGNQNSDILTRFTDRLKQGQTALSGNRT